MTEEKKMHQEEKMEQEIPEQEEHCCNEEENSEQCYCGRRHGRGSRSHMRRLHKGFRSAHEHVSELHKNFKEGKCLEHTHGKILGTATVGERGQVNIPAEAREAVDIKAGDKMVVFGNKRQGTIIMVKADIFNKFANFFMNRSQKLESIAQSIFSKIDISEEDSKNREKPEDK